MSNTVSRTVTDQELNAIIYQESKGDPNAAPRTSSALGLGQQLKSTWRDNVRQHRPDVFQAYPNGELLALRRNPSFNIEMLARLTEDNRRIVGTNATLGDLYLAHFLGVGTAKLFYRAAVGANAVAIAGDKAARANKSVFYRKNGDAKTVGEIRTWAQTVMDNASRKAGDYVAKFYKGKFVVPSSRLSVVSNDDTDTTSDEVVKVEERDDVENVIQRPGLRPGADYRLYDNQVQLKHMNYNPGGIDGVWGGGTAGAIAAFFNDYAPDARAPLKWHDYDANYEAIDATIDKAEAEKFIRPVTRERDEADPHVVERVAPEIAPAKTTFWTSVGGFFTAIGTTIYKGVEWALGYQDTAERWGIMSYIDKVPTWVWLAFGSAAVAFVVWKAFKTIKGIEKPITTGERM